MKKPLILAGCMILSVMMLSSTVLAGGRKKGNEEKPDPNAFYDFETVTEVISSDIFPDVDAVFPMMPEGYNTYPTEHKGTVEKLYYETDVYEDGVTYQKYCTVYLPYGYDPEDKDTKYNVLYFQHGHRQNPNLLWEGGSKELNAKYMVDNMFDPDHQVMEPCIIISPSYYFDLKKNTKFIPNDGAAPAGDGRYEGIAPNYYREIIEDLIPQIESQYNVYCEDFSEEGIKASRDHRAFAGFSRGSVFTWQMFHYNMEYFKYFVNMSAGIAPALGTLDTTLGKSSEEEAFDYIYEAIEAHPDLDFFIFATTGGDGDGPGLTMIPQVQEFYKHTDVFSYGTDPAVNNFYFARSAFDHLDQCVPYTWYAAKDILFH